jgi:hypothetical protein
MGPHSGNRTLALHGASFIRTDKPQKALATDCDGFSLNAAVSCQPYQRDRVRVDGKIQYALKNPFRNGPTHISCFLQWISLANSLHSFPDPDIILFDIMVS